MKTHPLPGSDPSRFALGIALPLGPDRWHTRVDGNPRDLARHAPEPPEVVFEHLERVIELSKGAGVERIERELTSQTLPGLFRDSDVVVLFAHGRDDFVELEDGELDARGFIAKMPEFSGCLDLGSCYSEKLANSIRFARGCVVAGRADFIWLRQTAMVYLHTLAGVLEERRPYCRVLAELLTKWEETR